MIKINLLNNDHLNNKLPEKKPKKVCNFVFCFYLLVIVLAQVLGYFLMKKIL